MCAYENLKSKVNLFRISLIILLILPGCGTHPPDCPNVPPNEILRPSVSIGWDRPLIWQDNEHILFQDEIGQLYVTSLDEDVDKLAYLNSLYDPPYTSLVGWSSDGSLLGFKDREQNILNIVNLQNGEERLFPAVNDGRYIAFSPIAPNIVILETGKGGFLWDISASFEDATRINDHGGGSIWSPDGKKIAYQLSYGARGFDDSHLRVKSIDDGEEIYAVPEGACQGRYSWSPDSQQIAFDARLEGGSDIYVATINGENNASLNVTNTKAVHEYHPQWSPNGDAIVFMGVTDVDKFSDDVRQNLYLLNLNTGQITQLTNSELYEIFPVWSPDGTHIAFMSTDRDTWYLEVMRADGSERKVLASWTE
jgi:dipeptidyl aminopeptidase/acylaminoacyl peptidase